MRSDRYEKKKKKGKWKSVLLILLLLIAGTLGYSYFQFKQGVSQTEGEANIQTEEFEFNGEKDKYGGTNILILGSDARGEEKSRADTIMVAQYHPEKGTYKLISFMRDMYVDIPGHGQNRINSALAYGGPELLRQTLKENFDIDIKYYSIIDFEGFVHLIDEAFPRGVEIDVEKRMSANIGVTLEPGLQRLDGEHLLGYVRFRQDAVGDFGRVERQQKVMKEVASQFTSLQTITKLPKLIGVVTPFVNTNMNTGDILYIGKDFLSKDNRNVETLRVPVDGTFENERINGAEVLGIDKEANKAAIHEFLSK
ncbi:LCP family protein [Cytobacillus firmus]|uniref:Regulatory protein MsrR n=1 Tax=Cytobacillus firmus TaxID=1399 RepID=A0A800NAN3_CYTFI|nr:LCP family protein [Cytobacillus firmus]KAF0823809.1 Cell envelope-associated transcriptional attenuator LytR-CpsA-Psr, subfamily F1 [Cytobacillus firmus]MDD9313267.1 LCP family protein [Cytobacillus firmus]MED1907929.1 LCP family protein [Cytobacillus firmus]MED1939128.1 LCP family protein [Cytobacillus firmus]NUH83124.1 LCP family protein [Cytobacillus firmus]